MIAPYGGYDLVNNIIDDVTLGDIVSSGAARLPLSEPELDVCDRIADGSLTPLDSFMMEEEVLSVTHDFRLSSNTYYPVPIIQSIPKSLYDSGPDRVILTDLAGTPRGYLDPLEYYTLPLRALCEPLFRTSSSEHPGVTMFSERPEYFVAGRVMMTRQCGAQAEQCMSPRQVRAEIEARGLRTVTAFHTRNVPHLGHEYLQRMALEITDGLLLHPIVGWKKEGDYTSEAVLRAYAFLRDEYYPTKRVILSGLRLGTLYAGPREAPWHAIIRQNFGCSHIVIGRDHAGVGGFYKHDEAHECVTAVEDELEIRVLKVMGPYYCLKCGMVCTSRTCKHTGADREEISGTKVREAIKNKISPPSNWMRKDLLEFVLEGDHIFVGR